MLYLIAHNIRSRENVGSLLRTSDSLGIAKLWLTGYTPTPPDPKIAKVALGAEQTVAWEQATDVFVLIARLKQEGVAIYALELTPDAQDLATFVPPANMALILGTETTGVPPSLLEQCDGVLKITQRGMKESMNVSVAAGIAGWAVMRYALRA
ncbi:MAG: TrmH family RNA methyltransferase [Patescibacteria group bacterium]